MAKRDRAPVLSARRSVAERPSHLLLLFLSFSPLHSSTDRAEEDKLKPQMQCQSLRWRPFRAQFFSILQQDHS